MVANTGHSRAQILDAAVNNLVDVLCNMISYYDKHIEQSPPSDLLIEAQELCLPIASNVECLPLIEALLYHCSRQRWEFPIIISQPLPKAPVSPLSQQFLEKVTHLMKSGVRLSYNSLVVLWTTHPPAIQQELMEMARTCMTLSSEKSFLTYINGHDLARACAQSSQLFDYSTSFLREIVEREPEKSVFFHLFNHTITRKILSHRSLEEK
ncbi:hypothetical protein GBAR_LOCUS23269 [Geodia barretti]|uniref:Uncharacterized protein n=1 Tax=Geodia barretti TaxID=519541 RepID=A0AA35T639_GEOBA|nr:hypothetical protein GBAR_LOCUS23269 [Geodia barretti]